MYGSEELRALLDNAHDKIVVIDANGVYQYVNAATERVVGYEPSTLLGTLGFEYVHPADRERVESAFAEVVGGDPGETAEVEYRHRTADGDYVWLRSRVANSTDARLDGYVVSSSEVADRRRAEAERAEMESRLRELAANTSDVLWMFDAEWSRVLFVNDAFEELWGVSVAALEDDPTRFLDGVHEDDRYRVQRAMEQLSAGESIDIEYRVTPNTGYHRWVWAQGRPVYEEGEVVRVAGFARDVTDRRRREQHLRVMGRLLRHNLRNDLNVILGHVELMHYQSEPPSDAALESIIETAEGLLATAEKERIIVETLTEADELVPVDLAEAVRSAVEEVKDEHPEATLSASVEEGTEVRAVPNVVVAIQELLGNAVTHSGNWSPTVSVSTVVEDDCAGFVVADNGPSIPENEYAVLTADRTIDRLSHGSGLGLWLVYWIVDLSNGEMSFERDPDAGNRITVLFRRHTGAE